MTALAQVYRDMETAFRSRRPENTQSLVLGDGRSGHPALMLIGEAPGETEERLGRPFVGKAGKNLDDFLTMASLRREEIYVSNVVKLRPTEQSAAGHVRNRPPNREELQFFIPWLLWEIGAVCPKYLVTLGNVPLKALTGEENTIGACHGQWLESRAGVPLFALYHPASIIYRRALLPVYEQDVRTLAAFISAGE